MEREILFRGKRADNGEWVYGSSLKEKACDGVQHIIVTENGEYHLINPKTRGQYTGLTDRNGVKIFEGDILEAGSGNRGYVVFINGAFMKSGNSKDMPFLIASDVNAVIGNVFDNPELMKGDPNV